MLAKWLFGSIFLMFWRRLQLKTAVKLLNYVPKGALLKFVAVLLERGMKLMTSVEAAPYIEIVRRIHYVSGAFLKYFGHQPAIRIVDSRSDAAPDK